MTACHYTPAQIGAMEMQDVSALLDYWADHPPVHEILAAVHGIKPREKEAVEPVSKNDPSGIGGLIAQFPNGVVPVNR